MPNSQCLWITGNSCCGKTTRLASLILEWAKNASPLDKPLILCANKHGKKILEDTLLNLNPLLYRGKIKTIFGVMREDVLLFYPLICQILDLPSIVPLPLRPETEQELATQLWHDFLTPELLTIFGNEYDCVRRILDFMTLAATGGIPSENIVDRIVQSNMIMIPNPHSIVTLIGELILQWRKYCLDKGFLTYALISELYWRYLLPNAQYQQYLKNNYQAFFADDVDDYPAISKNLAQFFLDNDYRCVFTFNNTGKTRLGYNADPEYLQQLASYCQQESLFVSSIDSLGSKIETSVLNIIQGKSFPKSMLEGMTAIKTDLRGDLLLETAHYIIQSITSGQVQPQDIAVIVAGLDEIARYTLVSSIEQAGIKVKVVNEQRALITSPQVRSILTMLPLLYEGLGRLVTPNMVAEMLVIFSAEDIDLVRGGLLADYCYYPDLQHPSLLEVETFRRWDRLSHKSLQSYNQIRDWVKEKKTEIQQGNNHFLGIIDAIIQEFFTNKNSLNASQIKILREFRETAEHFGKIQEKLHHSNMNLIISQFISLLRKGTITANPFPVSFIPPLQEVQNNAVSIVPIYQYRISRLHHPWQFWLDVSSPYWSKSSELFASSIFLKSWQPDKTQINLEIESEEERITRIVRDLLGRVTERVFLCHSTVDVNGNIQTGKLFPLTHLDII
ncbi:recombinase family protein [Geminocystis sp. CENA526]|uniref:recombinase family protein n=1 Tax=Geminocystis sp. CENA526 TaxID=1355871 RepID=UPI003D6EB033